MTDRWSPSTTTTTHEHVARTHVRIQPRHTHFHTEREREREGGGSGKERYPHAHHSQVSPTGRSQAAWQRTQRSVPPSTEHHPRSWIVRAAQHAALASTSDPPPHPSTQSVKHTGRKRGGPGWGAHLLTARDGRGEHFGEEHLHQLQRGVRLSRGSLLLLLLLNLGRLLHLLGLRGGTFLLLRNDNGKQPN